MFVDSCTDCGMGGYWSVILVDTVSDDSKKIGRFVRINVDLWLEFSTKHILMVDACVRTEFSAGHTLQ